MPLLNGEVVVTASCGGGGGGGFVVPVLEPPPQAVSEVAMSARTANDFGIDRFLVITLFFRSGRSGVAGRGYAK